MNKGRELTVKIHWSIHWLVINSRGCLYHVCILFMDTEFLPLVLFLNEIYIHTPQLVSVVL